jgi:hypothetical protein
MEAEKKRKYKINESLTKRNTAIKNDFQQMKKNGLTNREALIILADKYFLSEHTINSIVYSDSF